MSKIRKVAVGNRGEIAVRLLSACREMGLKTVLLYSAADKGSQAWRFSEENICIGPGNPLSSYLNVSAVINGALSAGADALHPGYGFLSESPALSSACEQNGLKFIGPSASCLTLFGDKLQAKKQAKACGLPLLSAYAPTLQEAQKIGFPVMIKSVHGGGGRGIRVVFSKDHWSETLAQAQREAQRACGSNLVFLEKHLPRARHIEVQVFGDSSGEVHYLFDRDCSIQRNHQKIIEEAPAPGLPSFVRQEMKEAAIKLMRSVSYQQAGTVEFLYQDEKFYFMEVNPRLQVECPVTEMILNLDLVKAQLVTAGGGAAFPDKNFKPRGHSIQTRVYAEDSESQTPVFGTLGSVQLPSGIGRRADMGFESQDVIPEFYDSMIGKIIAWDETRPRTIAKITQTLKETLIFGVKTNLNLLQSLVSHPLFLSSQTHIRFVEDVFLKSFKPPCLDSKTASDIYKAFEAARFVKGQGRPDAARMEFNPWKAFYD